MLSPTKPTPGLWLSVLYHVAGLSEARGGNSLIKGTRQQMRRHDPTGAPSSHQSEGTLPGVCISKEVLVFHRRASVLSWSILVIRRSLLPALKQAGMLTAQPFPHTPLAVCQPGDTHPLQFLQPFSEVGSVPQQMFQRQQRAHMSPTPCQRELKCGCGLTRSPGWRWLSPSSPVHFCPGCGCGRRGPASVGNFLPHPLHRADRLADSVPLLPALLTLRSSQQGWQ